MTWQPATAIRQVLTIALTGNLLTLSAPQAYAYQSPDVVMVNDTADLCTPATCRDAPALTWSEMNALQRHITFFDLDQSGKITLGETIQGLIDLGVARPLALPAAMAIHTAMGTPSSGRPSLTIDLRGIEAGIHGSDSGLYGNDGEFVPERFDAWFDKWDTNHNEALDVKELAYRLYQESDLLDVFGVFASTGEYAALFLVAAEDGEISKERMLGLFDGSLFYRLALTRGTLGPRPLPEELQ